MNENEIIKKFNKYFAEDITGIKDKTKGSSQIVKIIETKKNKYFIKIPKNKVVINRQIFSYYYLKNIIPIPKILIYSDTYLIEKYIGKHDLDEAILTKKESLKIYEKIGKILKKIHSNQTNYFGYINKKGTAIYDNFLDSVINSYIKILYHTNKLEYLKYKFFKKPDLNVLISTNLIFLISKKLISKKLSKNIIFYINQNNNFLNTTESVLLHKDFKDKNIGLCRNKKPCILDFGNLSSGPAAIDLIRQYIDHKDDGKFKALLRGYGKVNKQEIEYFAILHLIRKIPYYYHCYKTKKKHSHNLNDIKKEIKFIKTIINKK